MEKLLFSRCLKAGFNMVAREIKGGRKKTVDIIRTARTVLTVAVQTALLLFPHGPTTVALPRPPLAAGG